MATTGISHDTLVDFVKANLLRKDGKVKPCPSDLWWQENSFTSYKDTILEVTGFLDNPEWPQRLWHITNNFYEPTKCKHPECNGLVAWSTITSGYSKYCSRKCAKTCPISKKERVARTLEKYGVTHTTHLPEVLARRRATLVERYGVDSFSKTIDYREKTTKTFLERYGVTNPSKSPEIRQRALDTNIARYGAKHALCTDDAKAQQRSTNVTRYGGPSPTSDTVIREKQKQTLFARYGVTNSKHINIDKLTLEKLRDKDTLLQLLQTNSAAGIARHLGVDTTTVLNYLHWHGIHDQLKSFSRSMMEETLAEFLTANNITFQNNVRSVIPPKELDFYIPDHNLAIELSGVYWHSEVSGGKHKTYHYDKWKACADQGITLLTYFDDEYYASTNVIQSKILYHCKKAMVEKLHARNVTVTTIDNAEEKLFLEENHLQGFLKNRNYSYGAYAGDKLVGVLVLTERKTYLEITRYATAIGCIIRGLFEKMLAHHIRTTKYTGDIVTFSDNAHGNGNLYRTTGFTAVDCIGPSYYYTKNGAPRENRQSYMKAKIAARFGVDITGKTEWQLMQELGYDRIWDCGKIKWIKHV